MGNFKEDIARVEAFVFDIDGVFTDGTFIPLPDTDYLRAYNAKDAYAVSYALKQGYKIFVITGGLVLGLFFKRGTLDNRVNQFGIRLYQFRTAYNQLEYIYTAIIRIITARQRY